MGRIKEAAENTDLTPADPKDAIEKVLKNNWGRITAVMPRHMSPDRLLSLCTSTINKTPLLAQCTVASLLSCFMRCSSLGLEPSDVDGLGRAYILPYNTKNKATGRYEYQATFILGYKGMLDLARRSGAIKDIVARAVYEGDEFEYGFGLNERLDHKPSGSPKAGKDKQGAKLTHVYMIANFVNGGHYIDVMTADECEATRKRSKSPNAGPWVTDYEAMCKKTVIRRAFPYLPVSIEAQEAAAADETDGGFSNQFEFDPIIEPDIVETELPDAPEKPDNNKPAPNAKTGDKQRASAAAGAVEGNTGAGLATRKAVCTFCGHSMDKVAADATLEDLNAMGHETPEGGTCEHPHFEWSK